MNKNHPLDEVFRGKLRDFDAEAPMHLWEQVSQKRDRKHRFVNQMKQRKPLVALAGALVVSGLAWLIFASQVTEVSSFPIPLTTDNTAVASAEASTKLTDQERSRVSKPEHKNNNTNAAAIAVVPNPRANLNRQLAQVEYANLPAATFNEQPSLFDKDVAPLASNQNNDQNTKNNHKQTTSALATATPTVKPIAESAPSQLLTPLEEYKEANHFASLPEKAIKSLQVSPNCTDFSKHEWTFYVDALVSPDYVFRDIQANSPELENYAKSRRESEKYQYAFSGALRLSMVADNGLSFRTGINYSQINEKFTYFNGTEVTTTTTDLFDDQGNFIGVDTVVEIGTRYKVSHNTYRMLDIPFLVGYEFSTKKLNLAVNGGAYLNLMFRQSGDLLSPQDLQPVNVENGTVFKQQVGIGYYGSFSLAYQLSPDLQLIAEPHIKVFPNSVTQDQIGVQQRYSSAGLFIGLRKRL